MGWLFGLVKVGVWCIYDWPGGYLRLVEGSCTVGFGSIWGWLQVCLGLVQILCRVGLAFIYSAGSRIVALLCNIEESCFKFLWGWL